MEPEFEECITNENLLSSLGEAGVYVSDVVTTLKSGKVSDGDIVVYLQRVRERMQYLENSIDSLHACQLYRKTKMLQRRSEWLVGKRNNEAYFYNVPDEHYNVTKIIRKKKKFSLEQLNVLFDEEELDIKFVAANTKMLVSVG